MGKKKTTRKTAHKTADSHTHHKETQSHDTRHTSPQPTSPAQQNWITIALGVIVVILVVYIISTQLGGDTTTNPGNTAQNTGSGEVVIIEEFSDFECPFCARALPTIEQLKAQYGDNIEIVYRHFPLSIHPNAPKAAQASECARDQDMFWEYHDMLFANQQALQVNNLKRYAADLGLDTAAFNDCLDGGEKAALVQADFEEGRQRGVTGTPTFFIGDEKLVGAQPASAFQPIIDGMLGGAPQRAEDPTVQLTVISDATCDICDPTQMVNALTSDFFPSTQVTQVDMSEPEAQQLIEQYDINAIPAFIFDEAVTQTRRYAEVAQAFEQRDDSYVIAPAAVGQIKLLDPPTAVHFKGDKDAPITIIEYSDFECPFCTKFYEETYQQIVTEWIDTGKAKLAYKHFPLSFHPNAQKAAEAAECARDQNAFWEMHDMLFEEGVEGGVPTFKGYAADLGLDTIAFNNCLDRGTHAGKVQADMEEGTTNGIGGTPGFIINGVVLSGALPYESFEQILLSME